jgi:hypothetical protein
VRREPVHATASRVERWLLVEHCGPWGPPSLPLARMGADLGRHLTAEAARGGARMLLLRHPRGVDCPPGRRVFVVDSRPGRERVLQRLFADDAELTAAHLPLGQDEADGWAPFDGPLLLVCTHGSTTAAARCEAGRSRRRCRAAGPSGPGSARTSAVTGSRPTSW